MVSRALDRWKRLLKMRCMRGHATEILHRVRLAEQDKAETDAKIVRHSGALCVRAAGHRQRGDATSEGGHRLRLRHAGAGTARHGAAQHGQALTMVCASRAGSNRCYSERDEENTREHAGQALAAHQLFAALQSEVSTRRSLFPGLTWQLLLSSGGTARPSRSWSDSEPVRSAYV